MPALRRVRVWKSRVPGLDIRRMLSSHDYGVDVLCVPAQSLWRAEDGYGRRSTTAWTLLRHLGMAVGGGLPRSGQRTVLPPGGRAGLPCLVPGGGGQSDLRRLPGVGRVRRARPVGARAIRRVGRHVRAGPGGNPVSYTHLTLPTKRIV